MWACMVCMGEWGTVRSFRRLKDRWIRLAWMGSPCYCHRNSQAGLGFYWDPTPSWRGEQQRPGTQPQQQPVASDTAPDLHTNPLKAITCIGLPHTQAVNGALLHPRLPDNLSDHMLERPPVPHLPALLSVPSAPRPDGPDSALQDSMRSQHTDFPQPDTELWVQAKGTPYHTPTQAPRPCCQCNAEPP